MNTYLTEIKAINPKNGELGVYCGPNVPGISFKDAENYCNNNGLGYCRVIGLLVAEIPCDENYVTDWNNEINHDIKRLN